MTSSVISTVNFCSPDSYCQAIRFSIYNSLKLDCFGCTYQNFVAIYHYVLHSRHYVHLFVGFFLSVYVSISLESNNFILHITYYNCLYAIIGANFRHTLYPAYKNNRPPTPDTIVQGLQYLKASIKAMSIKVIEVNIG